MWWGRLLTTTAAVLVGFAATRKSWTVIMNDSTSFDVDAFHSKLSTADLGQTMIYKEKVSSTMTLAQEALSAYGQAVHGQGFLCEEQTAGVGRRGRQWKSSAAGNIYFSFIWAPRSDTKKELSDSMIKLNFALGIATVQAAQGIGVSSARIKWPNDVWIGDRKLSGSLVNFDGRKGGVAGVGINVNELFDKEDDKSGLRATSLAQEKGQRVPREEVLAYFCNALETVMQKPLHEVLRLYTEYDMLRDRVVRVHHKAREVDDKKDYRARVLGFSQGGHLLVERLGDGSKIALSGEEISVRPQP